MLIFKVVTKQNQIWQGVSKDFQSAADIACEVFLCPLRSIKSVQILRVAD